MEKQGKITLVMRIHHQSDCLRLKKQKSSLRDIVHDHVFFVSITRTTTHTRNPSWNRFPGMRFSQKVTLSPFTRSTQCHQAAVRLSQTRYATHRSDRWRRPWSHSAGKLQLVHNLFSRVSMERQISMQKFVMRNCDTFIVFTLRRRRRRRSPVSRWWTPHRADRIEMCLFFAPVIVLRF